MKKVIYVKFEVDAESYQDAEKRVKTVLSEPNTENSKEILKTHQFVNKVHM